MREQFWHTLKECTHFKLFSSSTSKSQILSVATKSNSFFMSHLHYRFFCEALPESILLHVVLHCWSDNPAFIDRIGILGIFIRSWKAFWEAGKREWKKRNLVWVTEPVLDGRKYNTCFWICHILHEYMIKPRVRIKMPEWECLGKKVTAKWEPSISLVLNSN